MSLSRALSPLTRERPRFHRRRATPACGEPPHEKRRRRTSRLPHPRPNTRALPGIQLYCAPGRRSDNLRGSVVPRRVSKAISDALPSIGCAKGWSNENGPLHGKSFSQRERRDGGTGRVADNCVDGPERSRHREDGVPCLWVQAPLAVRESVRRHVERDERSIPFGERIDERRPQRVVVLPSVYEQHCRTLAAPPRGNGSLLHRNCVPFGRDEPGRESRLRSLRRHAVGAQERLDGHRKLRVACACDRAWA